MTRTVRVVVALLVATLLVAACGGGGGDDDGDVHVTGATASPQPLGGGGVLNDVQVYTGLTQTHIEGPIEYRQKPPVGGDHNPIPLTCGAYDTPVPSANAVHSMEHGAVWITYRPDLPEVQQGVLQGLVRTNPYLVVSPWEDDTLPSPVVLSAWGRQLGVDSATDPAVAAFIDAFQAGPQTPEPGAACAGVGSPVATAGG